MDILFCTPSFNHPTSPLTSIFFEDQVNTAILNGKNRIRVISVNMVSLRNKGSLRYLIPNFISIHSDTTQMFIINFISLPKLRRLNFTIQLYLMKYLFRKNIKAYDLPQLIHAQQFEGGALALWAKRKFSVKYILTEHTSLFARNMAEQWQIELAGKVYSESSYNIAVSREFVDFLSGFFEVRFNYLPNVVDTDLFTPGNASKEKYIFVNVAGLDENKNHKLLIESFSNVFRGNHRFELLIIGDGPLVSELNILIDELKISEQVKLLGRLDRNTIKIIFERSSCFVLSSTYETFGIAIIEAMSCGLPVVSTKSKGPQSIIVDDRLGILCDNNHKDLGEAMMQVTKKEYDPEYIREYVVEKFSVSAISRSLAIIYKEVISC